MPSPRLRKAQGEDLKGKEIYDRSGASPIVQNAANKQAAPKAASRGERPSEDKRVSGGKVANWRDAAAAGFEVYYEKEGGRKGGRGKRV